MATDAGSQDRRDILATLENIETIWGQKPIRQIGYNRVEIEYSKNLNSSSQHLLDF